VSRGSHTLVIVESPAKAKTINKYLGSDYKVLASYGHVRDLPRKRRKGEQVAGVNIEGGWKATYEVVEREEGQHRGRRSAKDIIAELTHEANRARQVYLISLALRRPLCWPSSRSTTSKVAFQTPSML